MLRAGICFKCILFWSFFYFRQVIKKKRKKWRKKITERKCWKRVVIVNLKVWLNVRMLIGVHASYVKSIQMRNWNVPLILSVKVMIPLKYIKTLQTISIVSENSMQYLLTRWFFQRRNAHQICFLLWKQNSTSCVETNLVTWNYGGWNWELIL